MALGASVSTNQNFNGAVYVDSLSTHGEVHFPLYDGFVPASVPEPSSIAMLSASTILGLGYWIRRRRAGNRRVGS
jgi:hypothetical protein